MSSRTADLVRGVKFSKVEIGSVDEIEFHSANRSYRLILKSSCVESAFGK